MQIGSTGFAFAPTCGHQPGDDPGPTSLAGEAPAARRGDPLVGSLLGQRYRVESRLASGAMGSVYRARQLSLDKLVAVKVLHERLGEDPKVAARFAREATAAAQLDHPNLVQVLDAGSTTEGQNYLVMPLVEGEELRVSMDGPQPILRAVDLTLQLLAGLAHAHARGFVHRDVKPENVLVVRDADGRETAKLTDFGLVKHLDARSVLTEAGKVFGTPWYMAPEQATGAAVDARSDIYSLGAMLYELLSGNPPFDGHSFAVVLHKHVLADPPPLPSTVPAPVAAVVMRMLAKEPEYRYDNAAAAADALRYAAYGTPTHHTATPAAANSWVDPDLRSRRGKPDPRRCRVCTRPDPAGLRSAVDAELVWCPAPACRRADRLWRCGRSTTPRATRPPPTPPARFCGRPAPSPASSPSSSF